MQTTYKRLLQDDILPSKMPDVRLLRSYLQAGCPSGDPICLSFGETWTQAPAELTQEINRPAQESHGYQLSMYGLPELRSVLKRYIIEDHQVPASAVEAQRLEVAVTWSGTRGSMFDLGRYLLARPPAGDTRAPVVLSTGPSWDYTGVYQPLGFGFRYLSLRPQNGFRPDAAELDGLVTELERSPRERLALTIINAQHNPTAVNWDPDFIRAAIRRTWAAGGTVLLDDAYYRVHVPDCTPTSSLRILLEELEHTPEARHRWLMVRSLGKQFHANGWGLGALVGAPDTVDIMVNELRVAHQLMYGGILQEAMARFLASPKSGRFLREQQLAWRDKRACAVRTLESGLCYPSERIHPGTCTSYMLFAVPEVYTGLPLGVQAFRDDVFRATGVLLAPAWPWPWETQVPFPIPYVRMFLGPAEDLIQTALERMVAAGFRYDMRKRLDTRAA